MGLSVISEYKVKWSKHQYLQENQKDEFFEVIEEALECLNEDDYEIKDTTIAMSRRVFNKVRDYIKDHKVDYGALKTMTYERLRNTLAAIERESCKECNDVVIRWF